MSSQLLAQFLLRLSLGVAVSMGLTPPKWVWPAFFRIHLWVVMGLQTLAALVLYSQSGDPDGPHAWAFGVAAFGAALSYVGAVIWLYQKAVAGRVVLWLVAATSLSAAWLCGPWRPTLGATLMDMAGSGCLLGSVTTAMLLGHWYLNSPGMRLEPLQRLIVLIAVAAAFRAATCGLGWVLVGPPGSGGMLWVMASFRWLAGIAGPAGMSYLAWKTLRIPNTQSATGILYAAVIVVILGELVSQLISSKAAYAL